MQAHIVSDGIVQAQPHLLERRALGRPEFVARKDMAKLERATARQPTLHLGRQLGQHVRCQRCGRFDVFRWRHHRHRRLMLGAFFVLLKRGRAKKDHLAVLDRGDPAHRETAAIAGAVDVVDDGVVDIAGTQEIRMQRMRLAAVFHRRLRCRQRLAQHLPTEHVFGADVAALATEQVVFQALQRQQADQFGDDGFGGGGQEAGLGMRRTASIPARPRGAATAGLRPSAGAPPGHAARSAHPARTSHR